MSLQSIFLKGIFLNSKSDKNWDPPLEAVEKLFLLSIDFVEDRSLAKEIFAEYLNAIRKNGDDQIYSIIKAYFRCENASNEKSKLRQTIIQKISIESLDPKLRLIFLPDAEQALLLYEQFSQPLFDYLSDNLGVNRVEKILSSQKAVPLLKYIKVTQKGFDFISLNTKLSESGEVSLKDVEYIFSFFYNLLLTQISVFFGENVTSSVVKRIFDTVKTNYDYDIIARFLIVIPETDLEHERLAFLSRDELESKVHERTFLLKQEKERVDAKVKERTKELEEEKTKLAIVTENMNEGAILFDENYKVVYLNSRAKKVLNLVGNENMENIPSIFSKIFNGIDVIQSFNKALVDNIFSIPEIDILDKIYKIAFTVLVSESKKKRYLIWIEDITEPKLLERKKSEFVSVVAHQLRTPLSGIKWTLHMLSSGDLGELTDEQKSFVGKAYDSNDRMISLINDMLNVDRIVSGRLQYFFVKTQFIEIVDSVIYELTPTASKRGIKIIFEDRPKVLPLLNIDPEKIRAVTQNLIENAIKYTKNDGEIVVRIEEKSDTIHFEVKDNGIGIPPSEQSSIFSRFFRGSNALRVQTDGSGLGLFIAKSIIEAHKGTIGFNSELGSGSTFYFDIPKKFD